MIPDAIIVSTCLQSLRVERSKLQANCLTLDDEGITVYCGICKSEKLIPWRKQKYSEAATTNHRISRPAAGIYDILDYRDLRGKFRADFCGENPRLMEENVKVILARDGEKLEGNRRRGKDRHRRDG